MLRFLRTLHDSPRFFQILLLSPLFLGVCPPTLSKTTSAAKSFLPSKTFQSSPKPSNSSPTSPKSPEMPRASLLSPLKPFWLLPSLHRAFWDGIFEAKESPFLFSFFLFSFSFLSYSFSLSSSPLLLFSFFFSFESMDRRSPPPPPPFSPFFFTKRRKFTQAPVPPSFSHSLLSSLVNGIYPICHSPPAHQGPPQSSPTVFRGKVPSTE